MVSYSVDVMGLCLQGGVMIWEIGQDSFNEYSLLKTIHKEFNNLGFKTTELCKE